MSLSDTRVRHRPAILFVGIVLAMLASGVLLWAATAQMLVAIAYVLGLAVLVMAGFAIDRLRSAAPVAAYAEPDWRSEERRVGKECVSSCRYRWWPEH